MAFVGIFKMRVLHISFLLCYVILIARGCDTQEQNEWAYSENSTRASLQ